MSDSADFAHLHVHTQYSLLDGAIRLDALMHRAVMYGMSSVAITDHGTMFGTVEFYEKAKKAGLKPIIGCECYVAPRTIADKTPLDNAGLTHLVLLAENMEGYKNLCKLASIAQLEGFYHKPRIDRHLLAVYGKGLIGLSACLHGVVANHIQAGRMDLAEEAAQFYQSVLGENNFFLEIQDNGMEVQYQVNAALKDMGRRLSIPLVATNDCHYLDKQDARAHDLLLCIQTGKTIKDADRWRFSTDRLYFKSPDEMKKDFADYPEAIANTVAIADRCCVTFDFHTYHFPRFKVQEDKTPVAVFEEKVRSGFAARFAQIRKANPGVDEKMYQDRLGYEIDMIKTMGFPEYFLIVADFITYAKDHHIPVGPGRGSAAGSMVAFSLNITDLDPLEHGLIFERFLNPARKSMPDIDVDFCINGREEVYNYVAKKYGGGTHVAQIITFGKLKTRAVIRDVGRALDIPLAEVDVIAKLVPDVLNISLDDALEKEPKLRDMAEKNPLYAEWMDICRVLEGLPRHASTHAAGVVISDEPLVEYLPLYRGKKGEVLTQYDMKIVEMIGLVKFDFLGLRNLTVIADALSLIKGQNKPLPDLIHPDFFDRPTYQLLASGDTSGVFQLESSGMKDLLVRLKPECFEDIIALVALYRPGPLDSGMVDDFVDRKHGRKPVEYMVPQLEPILKETYGVIVYQEQVMQIAGALAKYSMSEADDLRKAMGKKIFEILAEHKERFIKGSVENGIPSGKAAALFDLIEKFGGYGFNKSHSAAYALIAFQTAYLKAHFPVEFLAALLTSEMHATDGVVKYIAECKNRDISVLPPNVNKSDKVFSVKAEAIIFGLVAVKNVGEAAIEVIIEERQNGPFHSLFDFCERVDLRKVNKRVIESLIKCGAFDEMGGHRAQLILGLEDALEHGQRVQREKNNPQMGLFDMGSGQEAINRPKLPDVAQWGDKERLAYEKEALGFYISGHPLTRYEKILDKFTSTDTLLLKESDNQAGVRLGGMVKTIKTIRTKKGDPMAFITLEDLHGSVEVVIFSSVYHTCAALLGEDAPLLIQGQVQKDENSVKILADTVMALDEAESRLTSEVVLTLDLNRTTPTILTDLLEVLKRHKGESKTYLKLKDPHKTETLIEISENFPLNVGKAFVRDVTRAVGYNPVETKCSAITAPIHQNGNSNRQWRGAPNG